MISGRRPYSGVEVLLGGALFAGGVGFLGDTIRRFFFHSDSRGLYFIFVSSDVFFFHVDFLCLNHFCIGAAFAFLQLYLLWKYHMDMLRCTHHFNSSSAVFELLV